MKRIMIITLALVLAAGLAQAHIPRTLNIQGVLTDDSGNVLPDGTYNVLFQIFDAPVDGSDYWGETLDIVQENGVFNVILGQNDDIDWSIFTNKTWLGMYMTGEGEMLPRIELTSVPSAHVAAGLGRNAAVLSLNGLKNNVTLQAGTNVTITQQDSTLTIAAAAAGGGDDGDWEITGTSIAHPVGRVYIGMDAPAAKDGEIPPLRGGENGEKDPDTSRLTVYSSDEGLYSVMREVDSNEDGRSALFGRRMRSVANAGTGFTVDKINSAVIGYNDWGDSYTFGVAGYTWFDFNNTGAVFGARNSGDYWGSLAFRDGSGSYWGMYTPNNLHAGGLTETASLRVTGGAAEGYILTSDADGNAAWSAPSAATSDGDWTVSGYNIYNSSADDVAIGTGYPHPHLDSNSHTTLQVSALFTPAVCLDAIYGGLKRWTIYQGSGKLQFSKSTSFDEAGYTSVVMEEAALEVNRLDGDPGIRLQGGNGMESGSKLAIYSTSTSTTLPSVVLDGQDSTSRLGGSLTLRNGLGSIQVVATADHDGTCIGRVITPVLEITGGSDLSEQFDIGNADYLSRPGMVVCIDPENPGGLTLSDQAYDRRVAGVISGAGGISTGMVMGQQGTVADGEHPVALVGRVYVWADASAGPITPGDLLTTSDRPGYAMKVADHHKATGAILGKAMTGLDEGQGLILTLISLQ